MNNKASAALGAAAGVAVTVAVTQLIARLREPVASAEEQAALEDELQKARAEGWFSGRDHLLEQLQELGHLRLRREDVPM